ncbi:MAG: MBL fold metallo-hydrolase [Propionibacteriaceae bacterium]|nr:MBL fold metallo-hydrolase [Propionibacteriaceae bacterium]
MSIIVDTPLVMVRTVAVGPMNNNVYLLTVKETGYGILIDAADEPDTIDQLIREAAEETVRENSAIVADRQARTVEMIITTHAHFDHTAALADMVVRTGARTAAGRADAEQIESSTGVATDLMLDDGATVGIAGLSLAVIGLRGHTPGSIALAYCEEGCPAHLFSGDSLFPGGVGNTNQDPARFASLYADVVSRLFDVYPDDTIVWPGHGNPTTLGTERPHLGEWKQRGW